MGEDTKIPMSVRLHPDVFKEVNSISKRLRVTRTSLVQIAISEYIARQSRIATLMKDDEPIYAVK